MTAEEINLIPAGPELDRLISERIFARHNAPDVPKFSQDIAAAWLVIERLTAGGIGPELVKVQLSAQCGGYASAMWRADLGEFTGRWVITTALTAPLAICRAALTAANFRSPI